MDLKVKNCKIINFETLKNYKDGKITVAQVRKNIPFDIKRVFFIYDFKEKNSVRGQHAHKNLQQVIICLSGSFELILDDGFNKEKIILNNPSKGVFIGRRVWLTMKNFTSQTIILVLASDYYKPEDYVKNYNEFLTLVKKK